MADFGDLLIPGRVLADVAVGARKPLFALLAQRAARSLPVAADVIADALADRERLGSTGFGDGVAIPHARLAGLNGVAGVFVRLAQPIDFRAVDAMPVDLVFALLSPVAQGAEHLKALARVSRRLRDQAFLAKLRGAAEAGSLYALLVDVDARNAA